MSILGLGFQKKMSDFFAGKTKPVVFPYGKNLFNKDDLIEGKLLNSLGVEGNLAGWYCTDYIWVVGGTKLIASHSLGSSSSACIVIYDANKSVITAVSQSDFNSANRILTLPSTAEYVRFSLNMNLEHLQIEYGTTSTDYEAFSAIPRQPSFREPQKIVSETLDDYLTSKNMPFVYTSGKNLFNKNTITVGSYVNSSGSETIASGWACTDYIFVIGGLKVKLNGLIGGSPSAGAAFYDGVKNLISFMSNNDIDAESRIVPIPDNAKFVRFSFVHGSVNLDTYQIEYGEVSTTYEAFNPIPTLPSFRDIQKTIIKDIEVDVRNKYASNEFSAFTFPHGKNLFNPDAVLIGNTIYITGGVSVSAGWKCTNFISILGSSKLKISGPDIGDSTTAGTAFYDKNKTFISFVSNTDIKAASNVLSVPHNATYMRFTTNAASHQLTQIEYGEVSTAFETFNPMPTLPQFNKQLKVEVDYKCPTGTFMPISIPHGKNLFNKDTAVDGVLINDTGKETSNVDWFSSDFIPVIQNSKLKFNGLNGSFSSTAGTAFYDSYKKFMSFVSASAINSNGLVINVPKNAVYLRFCEFGLSRKNTIQLEYGLITTSYEEYSPIPRMPIIDNIKITNDLLPFEKILNSNSLDIYKDTAGSLHACFRNVYVRYDRSTFYIYNNGLKANPSLVTFDSTSFPGLIAGSLPIRIFILPFSRNATSSFPGRDWRLNVVTSKGQVYHNFPSRNTTSDGTAQANDHMLFDEGCIWELPERWAPVKTTVGEDADLIATGKYKYYPALAESAYEFYPAISTDNGYGNNGFPAVLEKTNQSGETVKFARFHQPQRNDVNCVSLDYMGGLVINEKLCVIGTYRNNIDNQGARICVFYTNDGGRNWFCRYEFGAAGQLINSSDAQLMSPVTNHIPHDLFVDSPSAGANLFQIIKRSQYTPTADVKEPTNKFKYSSPVPVSSITAASNKITVVTSSAHGLVSGDIILFEKQSGADSNEWDWLVNSGHNSNSAGDGLIFKVVVVNSTSFTLKQEIHNPHNNLACRHIHSLNKSPHGIAIGCGETYPQGWILLHNYVASDSFFTLMPWDDFSFIRLTSTNVSAQRPLGFLLKHDGTYLIGMDNESTYIGNIALPTGRTGDGIRKSSTGVYKGNITNVDDLGQAECVLESNEVAYFFQEINGVILFIGQLGEIGISSDGGETWIRWKINEPAGSLSRLGGAMNDRMFMVQNYLFHLKG